MNANTSLTLRCNPDARWTRFDGAQPERWRIDLIDARGRKQHVVVSSRMRQLMDAFASGANVDDVLAGFSARGISPALRDQLQAVIAYARKCHILVERTR